MLSQLRRGKPRSALATVGNTKGVDAVVRVDRDHDDQSP